MRKMEAGEVTFARSHREKWQSEDVNSEFSDYKAFPTLHYPGVINHKDELKNRISSLQTD